MYKEINISFNEKNYSDIYNALYVNGIEKILEEDGFIKIYYKGNETIRIENIKKQLIKLAHLHPSDIRITTLPTEDWGREWKMSIEPVNIKDKIFIYPSWKKQNFKDNRNKILIEIDPKMSFGTGHNDTTKLILEMMVDYVNKKDKYLLDFGCGTGILAIAGIKLGIKNAVAIDIDSDSIRDAKDYIKNNRVTSRIKLYKKDINDIKEKMFDVILCNIISSVILENIETIWSKLKYNGKLFLTGILKNEKNNIIKTIHNQDFTITEIREKGEWVSFYCKKN